HRTHTSCLSQRVRCFRRASRIGLVLRCGLLCAVVTASPTAAAQDAATAEALFLQGRQAADAGDYPLACARFEESNRLDAAPGTLLNLADCEEHLGHLAKAWQQFRQLDDQLPASDPRRPIAVARARALEPRIPKLRIVLVSPVPATAARDGVVLGLASLGVHLPVDPGRHVVVVSAAGRVDRLYELQLSEGQDAEVTVMPGDMSAPPPGPAYAGASSSSATQPPTQQADAARTLDRSA